MTPVTLRPYQGSDETALLKLWNLVLTHDPINEAVFRTQVLLDLNFRPEGLLLAEKDGELAGFLLSIVRHVPLFLQGLEPDRGWITAFGVHPAYRRQGVGKGLFEAALLNLHPRQVLISPYTPNYFTPGVDTAAYPEAVAFLHTLGWKTTSTPISMQVELTGFQIPGVILELEARLAISHQITVEPVCSADIPQLIQFIAAEFGWDWTRFAHDYLLSLFGTGSDEICFLVAKQGQKIVGYCQQRRERFGPFGVSKEMRGLGIGRLLLFRCLADMLTKGFHCAWFLWTGSDAACLYSLAGFHPVRQFAVMLHENRTTLQEGDQHV